MIKYFTYILLCLPTYLVAQSAYNVEVYEFNTEIGVADVELIKEDGTLLGKTNSNGVFTLETEEEQSLLITFYKEGFDLKAQLLEPNKPLVLFLQPIVINLDETMITNTKENDFGLRSLRTIEDFGIFVGKKSEVISLEERPINVASNNSRQAFAKVPGFNIWESDCAGLQLGIGGRGLSPNRSSNFNMRQNGYDISADPMGYPESYYSPPLQAVERIEVVRGAASLQYGSQFGGRVNFVLKDAPDDKNLAIETSQSLGSYWYFNSFNSIGWRSKNKQWKFYTYYQYRRGNCWRCNSEFQAHNAFAKITRRFEKNKRRSGKLSIEHTFFNYLTHQAGGLTDALFNQNARQSIRDRNWFKINWHLSNANFELKMPNKWQLQAKLTSLNAGRDAVGFLGRIDRTDDPENNRDLLVDRFHYGVGELRLLKGYNLKKSKYNNLLIGVRGYYGQLQQAQGLANADNKADFNFLNPESPYQFQFKYPGINVAMFIENVFNWNNKWYLTAGARMENLQSKADGYYYYRTFDLADNVLVEEQISESLKRQRNVFLFGLGLSYKPKNKKQGNSQEYYFNFAQNYRPIGYNDFRVSNVNLVIDPELTDEKGFNVDLGYRANINKGALYIDASLFYLFYNNKIGNVLQSVPDPILGERLVRLRTNVAKAGVAGTEFFGEYNPFKWFDLPHKYSFSVFGNCSFIQAQYLKSDEPAINKNQVEYVPPVNLKTGLTFKWGDAFSASFQNTFVSQHYSDATNAEFTASAVEGTIPNYFVMDFSAKFKKSGYLIAFDFNNLNNVKYFTRRASGYPGPGIIPAEGRAFYISLGYTF